MGRSRSELTADLPPNLYVNPAGYYYFKNPHTGKQMGLRRDKAKAMEIAVALNAEIDPVRAARDEGRRKSLKSNRRFDSTGLVDGDYLRANAVVFEKICGIYFLLLDGEVTYIGQSINCHFRISVHIAEKKKDFNSCYIIRSEPEDLDNLEALYIKKFTPRYNILLPRCGEKDAWRIEQRLQNR